MRSETAVKDRFEIAAELRVIARLLTVKGENPFKVQAYERGARALETFHGDFDKLVKAGRLKEIAGVGNALSAISKRSTAPRVLAARPTPSGTAGRRCGAQ
jgi:DNA polymerase/3'-5' exonuclease PolX